MTDAALKTGGAAGEAPLGHGEKRVLIIGTMFALALAALDQTIIVTALPSIAADLGGAEKLSWVVTAYLLTATTTAPLYGKFSDIRGRRAALLLGMGIFAAGSAACALAPNMPLLVVARGLQGIGAGGLIAIPMTIVGDVVPPRERGRYQAYIASVYALSSIAGPVIGGSLAQFAHWSLIFWINLPIALVAYMVAGPALRRLPRNERPHRLDLVGAALLIGATSTLLLSLTWAGTLYGWTAGPTLGLLAAAVVLWALFAWRLAVAEEPLIPLGVLRNRVVAYGVTASSFTLGTFIGLTVAVPLYFEVVLGHSASISGLAVIPLMIGTPFGATSAGRLMARVVHYKRLPLAGLAWSAAALAVIALAFDSLPATGLSLVLAVVSVGFGTVLPVTTVAIQNAVKPHEMGTATSINTFCRQMGGAFIVAAFGAILVAGGAGTAVLQEGATTHAPAADAALVEAFRLIFLAASGTAVAAFAMLLLMEERPLQGQG